MQTENALDMQHRLDRLISYLESDPDNINLAADVVGAAIALGDWNQAQLVLDQYLSFVSESPLLKFHQSIIHIHNMAFALAEPLLETLWLEGMQDLNTAYAYALVLLNLARPDEARDKLLPYLAAPNSAEFTESVNAYLPQQLLLARCLQHLRQSDATILLINKILEYHPDNFEARCMLVQLYGDLRINDKAIALADELLSLDSDNAEANSVLGSLALDDFEFTRAEQFFNNALSRKPNSGRALLGKAVIALARQETEKADKLFADAVEFMPLHIGAAVAHGWCKIALADYTAAEAVFEKALLRERTFGETHAGLGIALFFQDRYEEAKRCLKIAKRLSLPDTISVTYLESLFTFKDVSTKQGLKTATDMVSKPFGPKNQPLFELMISLQHQVVREAEEKVSKNSK